MERTPQTLVLDASTAAKWFLDEEDSDRALRVRDAHIDGSIKLTAPDLIVYEIANALNYNSKVSDAQLAAQVQDFSDYDLDLVPPSAEYATRTVKIARELSVSVYDASYIALSDIIATNLITADKKLHQRIVKKRQSYLLHEMGQTWNLPGNHPGQERPPTA
jgi:predicted nucleic acid-binding protein